ncbi:DUF4158 domain-containing protein [Haloactinomyces albus]|uniref:DUF4158 domain-containing protein n=1 Tax=Haloactinomyces albus TaxID=1352928 RepID=A0AAE3ZJX9_9ACTN|nr:DUF4158 domain-containing protein [Haloactinomyces albus]MDR7304522.1 hypothetical protein [Haloactinomyces albus]
MRQSWEPDELVDLWTLVGEDWRLVGNKSGATRLGFRLLLKFFEIEARVPAYPEETPAAAVNYVASQVRVEPTEFTKYSLTGRTVEYHRSQIRDAMRFRPATEADEQRWTEWLSEELVGVEMARQRSASAVLTRCRQEKVEPPTSGRVEPAGDRLEVLSVWCTGSMPVLSGECEARKASCSGWPKPSWITPTSWCGRRCIR